MLSARRRTGGRSASQPGPLALLATVLVGPSALLAMVLVGPPAMAQEPVFVPPTPSSRAPVAAGIQEPSAPVTTPTPVPVSPPAVTASQSSTAPRTLTAPPPTRAISLAEALDLAARDKTETWRLRVDQAQQGVSIARDNLNPIWSTTVRVRTRNRVNAVDTTGGGTSFIGERSLASINVSYPLYDGGQLKDQLQVARAGLRATTLGTNQDKLTLQQMVEQTYFLVMREQRDVTTAELIVSAAREHLTAAEGKLEAGTATKGDVYTAKSAASTALSQEQARNAALITGRAQLASLVGLDPMSNRLEVKDFTPSTEADLSNAPVESLVSQAMANSPSLARLHAEGDQRKDELAAVKARRSPTVTLGASAGYVSRDQSGTTGASSGLFGLVTVNLSVPILDQPTQRANEKQQEDSVALSKIAITDYGDQLREQAVILQTDVQQSDAVYASAFDALAAAQEAHRLASERYAVGRGTQSEVLDALARLAEARDALVQADVERAATNLRLANFVNGQVEGIAPTP